MINEALIPGLPEDVALECISRIPHNFHSQIRPVSKKWRDLVTAPFFYSHRHQINASEHLLFLIQADPVTAPAPAPGGDPKGNPVTASPVYSLTLFNSTLSTWVKILDSVPMFTQVVIVGHDLIMIGGWDPKTLDPIREVRILDLKTMTWRAGRPMTSSRSFFACAAINNKVYVAGGHDSQKNALKSAEVYDVAADEWRSLPEMKEERDECKGLNINGKFWVVSGYGTENQGRFGNCAEVYDDDRNEWEKVENAWDGDTCVSVFEMEGKMMSMDSRGLREFVVGEGWRVVGPGIEGVRSSTCAAGANGEGVVVVGGAGDRVWRFDLSGRKWVRVEASVWFNGFVYSGCSVRI